MTFLISCSQGDKPNLIRQIDEVVVTVPAPLLKCLPAPVPGDIQTQAELAEFLAEVVVAGDDCRSKLNEVRSYLAEQGAIENGPQGVR